MKHRTNTVQTPYKHRTNTVQTPYKHRTNFRFFTQFLMYSLSGIILFYLSCTDQGIKFDNDDVIAQTEIRSEIENPFCNGAACSNPILVNKSKTYFINGCEITVYYKEIYCNFVFKGIRDFSHSFAPTAACRSVKQQWNQYYLAGQTLEANLAMNNFYKMLTLMVQDDIVSGLDPNDYPNGYIDFQWIETKCHVKCAKEVKFDDLPSYFDISYAVCGNGCCIREQKYTNVNGMFVKDGDYNLINSNAFCDPVTVQCVEGGTVWDPLCRIACERL